MSPAKLALLGGQVVVSREAIAHDNPAKGVPYQLDGGGCRSTQALDEYRHQSGEHDPLQAALSIGIDPVSISGGVPFSTDAHKTPSAT